MAKPPTMSTARERLPAERAPSCSARQPAARPRVPRRSRARSRAPRATVSALYIERKNASSLLFRVLANTAEARGLRREPLIATAPLNGYASWFIAEVARAVLVCKSPALEPYRPGASRVRVFTEHSSRARRAECQRLGRVSTDVTGIAPEPRSSPTR